MRKINRAGLISTHAPYTEGDSGMQRNGLVSLISTHAPYTEGDEKLSILSATPLTFQLTPPIQRATQNTTATIRAKHISTHAPYTEGDRAQIFHIYIPPLFQLTPPIQRATAKNRQYSPIFRIIINNYNPCNRKLRNIL